MSHTPGPWEYVRLEGENPHIVARTNNFCLDVKSISNADRHLIASAPELLANLEYANNILKNIARGMAFTEEEELATRSALDRIIAKAKGQS